MKYVILIVAASLLLAIAKWAFLPWLPYRRLPRHRVRHLRLRVRLRLHPGHGHATLAELWLRWGRLAAFRRSGRARRSLGFWERMAAPASAYSILIGRAHLRHGLRLPLEEHVLVTSPPRGGKTGWLASVILRYPGPVLSTTTKHDVFELTSGVRAQAGPVHVFNPQGIGGVPSTFGGTRSTDATTPPPPSAAPTRSPSRSPSRASRTPASGPARPATTCGPTSSPPHGEASTCWTSRGGSPAAGRRRPSRSSCASPVPAGSGPPS